MSKEMVREIFKDVSKIMHSWYITVETEYII